MRKNRSLIFSAALMMGVASQLLIATRAQALDKKAGWQTDAEAGVVLTTGNTQTNTISLKDATAYGWLQNNLIFSGNFLNSSDHGIEQAYQWGLGLRYERDLNDRLGVFLGELLQSDKYQSIQQRYATDVGGKYTIENVNGLHWFVEGGYRFTRENYTYGTSNNINFVRLYNEIEKAWTKTFSAKWWVEYLPNLSHWAGYQFNTEVSISTVLTDIFSLKSAYLLRYYNTPPGVAEKTDTTFTTSLVAKF